MQEYHQIRKWLAVVGGLSLALPACSESTQGTAEDVASTESEAEAMVCAAEYDTETATDPVTADADPVVSAPPPDPVNATADLATIRNGVASFDPPRKMTRGEMENVRLVIGADQPVEQTEILAADGGAPVSVTIDLGLWVCAELFASSFELKSDKVQCHNFGKGRFKSFDWDIVPVREGSQSLQVEVISYDRKGGEIVDSIPSKAIDVTVDVRLPGQIDDMSKMISAIFGSVRNLLLSLAAMLAALTVVIWRIRRLGQKPDASDIAETAD